MSKSQIRVARHIVSTLTATATAVAMLGSAALGLAVTPADYGLHEGDVISAHAQTGDPDVYIVNEQGYKRLFVNPQIFNLYGHLGWDKIKPVSAATRDAFPTSGLFRNCESGDQRVYGLEVVSEDVANLHWINMSGAQAVAEDANFFNKVFCINNNEQALYGTGADWTSLSQVPDYARGETGAGTGPFGASLAPDNPAAQTLIAGQGIADLAHFNITGSGLVTKVELQRLGVSGDSTLSNVFMFVNGARMSDGFTFNQGTLTFNNPNGFFNAPANLSVRSTIASSTSGQTVGVGIRNVNGSAVSVDANLHSIAANPGDLAAVSVNATTTGAGNIDPQADVTLWQNDLSISGHDVWLRRLSLRLIGSAPNNAFTNFKLYVDGVQVATATGLDANGYVHFVLNHMVDDTAPFLIRVTGDIVGGSGRTYQFQLKGSYDLEVVDAIYGVTIAPTGTFPAQPSQGTIGAASLTIVKAADSPSGDMVLKADDVVLGRWTVTAYGEQVKVDTFTFRASSSNGSVGNLRDGRVLIDGAQYGSTQNLTTGSGGTETTVNYIFQPGQQTTVELRGDAFDNDGTNDLANADIVSSVLLAGSSNAEGLSSGDTLNAPSTAIESNNRTVVTGSPTLSKDLSYADQTVVLPQSAYKIGSWNLKAPNSEGVNVTQFSLEVDESTGTTFNESDLRDLYIMYGSTSTTPRSTVTATSNTFSISRSLNPNEVLPITAYATLLSGNVTAGDAFGTDLTVTGTTLNSASSFSPVASGQIITFGQGNFTAARDTNVAQNDRIVGDEQTVTAVGYEFTAVNDSFKISRLNLTMPNASGISEVRILDGSTVVASLPAATDMTFNISSGNQPLVTPSAMKKLSVDLVLSTIASPGGGASGANHTVTLVAANSRRIAQSTGVEAAFSGSNIVGKALYAYKAIPTITRLALPSTVLVGGGETKTIAKFNVGSGGTGTIGWIKAILNISQSTGSLSSIRFYDAANESVPLNGTVSSGSGTITFVADDELPAGDYTVKATINGTQSSGDSVTVNWQNSGIGFVAPAASASVGATATLVWTDRFSLPHTELTPDWNNDNLVKNIPLDSWSLVK